MYPETNTGSCSSYSHCICGFSPPGEAGSGEVGSGMVTSAEGGSAAHSVGPAALRPLLQLLELPPLL